MDFDVFLCHHSTDKEAVQEIARRLQAAGLHPWLDEWELRPGQRWQKEIERLIATIPTVAVFVGPEGVGPWQDHEIDAFLRQTVKRGCPVIPVILPGSEDPPALPLFLEGYTWVDFRKADPEPMGRLVWGIRGDKSKAPGQLTAPKRRAIRLYSTKESVRDGEVSVLAIFETLAAVALVFYLANHLATLDWLAVAICVAPLLLLRTDESTRLGIEYFDSFGRLISEALEPPDPVGRKKIYILLIFGPWLGLAYIGIGFAAVAARFGATLVTVLRSPGEAMRALPRNWARLALATDSFCTIEPIPNHPKFQGGFLGFLKPGFDEVFGSGETADRSVELLILLIAAPLSIFVFLPALFYRWSLKATSIIYAPLVFVTRQTFARVRSLRDDLRVRKTSSVGNLSVVVGCIFILAFLTKLAFFREAQTFIDWWNAREVGEFVALYVAPAEIPKWQLSSLLNSVLAIVMFFFVREALVRIENNLPWPESAVGRILRFTSSLRVVLTTYTILCTGYITIRAAQHWDWPAIAEKWFPWQ